MTESEQQAEQQAVEAWDCMFHGEMPPAIGLDFVQDVVGDRAGALIEILTAGVKFLRLSRPEDAPTSFANGLSLEVCLLIHQGAPTYGFSEAMSKLAKLKERLIGAELVGPTLAAPAWLHWCEVADHTIRLSIELCGALAAEATAPDQR